MIQLVGGAQDGLVMEVPDDILRTARVEFPVPPNPTLHLTTTDMPLAELDPIPIRRVIYEWDGTFTPRGEFRFVMLR